MKFYYIHGYGSNGETTFNGLKQAGLKNLKLVSWTSDRDYSSTLSQIISQIDLNDECSIIASSFGGFWASQLPSKNLMHFFLVNPLVDVYKDFYLKKYSNTFTKNIADTYKNKNNIMISQSQRVVVYLAKSDEVLDYRRALDKYKNHAAIKFISGGHQLTNYKQVANDVLKDMYQVSI